MDMNDGSVNDIVFERLGHRVCNTLPSDFPVEFRAMQLCVYVDLVLTAWNCVSRAFYESYAVTSLEEAIARVHSEDDLWLCYGFYAEQVIPAYAMNIDWPLSRRGGAAGISRRRHVEGAIPGTFEPNPNLFVVWRKPLSPWRGRVCLATGGRSTADAMDRWQRLATPLRRVLSSFRVRPDESARPDF
jgi:hypothetical protein